MRIRTLLVIIVVAATAAFLFINWRVLAAPVKFNFLLTAVEIPVGLVMLALLALVVLAFAAYVGMWQGTLLIDYRRQAKELQAQRALAEDAEGSRFTALSALLREEISQLDARLQASLDALRGEIRDSENSIAATLGEMDDRMARSQPDSLVRNAGADDR
jgi:uncharacterized protein HemX